MINIDKVILFTLKVEKSNDLLNILRKLDILKIKQDIPVWMEEIKMFDDEIQQRKIINGKEKIKDV